MSAVGRERIRQEHANTIRDALQRLVNQDSWEKPHADAAERSLNAILAQLEQAEKERDGARLALESNSPLILDLERKVFRLEARLAKVPALVEMLLWLRVHFVAYDQERTDGKTSPAIARIDEVLAAWEAE